MNQGKMLVNPFTTIWYICMFQTAKKKIQCHSNDEKLTNLVPFDPAALADGGLYASAFAEIIID